MKLLISILIGLLVVGCGKKEPLGSGSEYNAGLATDQNTTKAEPAKELSLEEKVVGAYKSDGHKGNVDKAGNKLFEYGMDLLNDGTFVHYINGEKTFEGRWEIKGSEIHQILEGGMVAIYRLNPDMSLTNAESLLDETLLKIPEGLQYTYTKIKPETNKTPSKSDGKRWAKAKSEPVKELTPEEKKVVGTYEKNFEGINDKLVLHENRVFEGHKNGEKQADGTWKIVGKEVFAEGNDGSFVFKMEQNGDLTLFALIQDGKRTNFPNSKQLPLKKIK